jgi:polysaccharide biosynthesis transport protein
MVSRLWRDLEWLPAAYGRKLEVTEMTQPTLISSEPHGGASAHVKGRNFLEIAWSRKSLIGLGVVVGLTVGLLFYFLATPVYQSKAQILVVKKRPDSFTGIDTRSLSIEDFVATHKTLIESPTIIEGAVERGNLSRLDCFADKEDLTELIQKSLVVTRNRSAGTNNNVLDLAVRTTNPGDSELVLNAIIESYKDYLDVTYRSISDDTVKLIMQAREVLEQDLKKQDTAYRSFRQNAPVLLSRNKDGTSLTQERLSSIETKRSMLLVRKAEIQGYLQAIDAGIKTGASQESLLAMISGWSTKLEGDVSGPSERMTLNNQLYPLLQEEQKLLETRGENHPELKALRQRIEITRKFVGSPNAAWYQPTLKAENSAAAKPPVEMYRDYFTQQLNHVEISEKLLHDLYKEQFTVARALANYEVEDDKQRRDISMTEKLLDSIIKKLEDVNLVKNVGGYDAKTIAPAALGKKVYPSGLAVFPVALLMGGIFGFGLAYLAESRDKSFRNVDEVGVRLGLPLVGQIPCLKASADDAGKSATAANPLAPILYAHYQPKSAGAEAYRSVRTALFFSIPCKGHTVIQVTSPNDGDGKSTLAANLAVSIAQTGKKVLLLDADMRTPTIHTLFGLSAKEGLSSVIVGNLEPKEVIQAASIPGLSILPCGPIPPNPAELLTSPRFKELLTYLREQYDFVIIDSPALLAVTDPSIVAHQVDGVFLAIRFTKNGRPDAERAKAVLVNHKANIIGVVVNDSESLLNTSGYTQRFSEGYVATTASAPAFAGNEHVKA